MHQLQGLMPFEDAFPAVRFIDAIGGATYADDRCGDALLLFSVVIEFPDKDGAGVAVLKDVSDGVGCECRIDRDGYTSCHHDGNVCHDPVRAILGQDRDMVSRLQIAFRKRGGHPPAFLSGFRPSPGPPATIQGLSKEYAVRLFSLPAEEIIERAHLERN